MTHATTITNGQTNGMTNGAAAIGKRKRAPVDDEPEFLEPIKKRGRVLEEKATVNGDDVINLDDDVGNGAIVIEDD